MDNNAKFFCGKQKDHSKDIALCDILLDVTCCVIYYSQQIWNAILQ
jgi:hypothetical protein